MGRVFSGQRGQQVRAADRVLIYPRLDRDARHAGGRHRGVSASGHVLGVGVRRHPPVVAGKPHVLSLRDHVAVGVVGVQRRLRQRAVGLRSLLRHGRKQLSSLGEGRSLAQDLPVLFGDRGLVRAVHAGRLVDAPQPEGRGVRAVVQFGGVAVGCPSCLAQASVGIEAVGGLRHLVSMRPLLAVIVYEARARPLDRMRRRDVECVQGLAGGLSARRVA